MKFYLYKLIPPRPTFILDMDKAEMKVMQQHVGYWTDLMGKGLVVAFGPVADPKGAYGVGIVELQDDADPQTLGIADPAIKAGVGFDFEIYPMPRAVVRT